jgi:hypothetical protein
MTLPAAALKLRLDGVKLLQIALLFVGVWMAGCTTLRKEGSVGASEPKVNKFIVKQGPPALVDVTIGVAKTKSAHGDMLFFEPDIERADGVKGVLLGQHVTVDLDDPATKEEDEDRLTTLYFLFGNEQLMAMGGASYPVKGEMNHGKPFVRVGAGGTGR